MARYVSKYKKYSICYQRDIIEHYATGESRVLKPLLNCQFDLYGSMYPWEMEAARGRFINTGTMLEMDNVTTVDPAYRFSVFDSERFARENGLPPEELEKLDLWLQNKDPLRSNFAEGHDYIFVEAPVLAPPWPKYDDLRGVRGAPTAQRIAERVIEDGYDVADVIAYERQKANRADVIDALEALLTAEVVEDEELVSA